MVGSVELEAQNTTGDALNLRNTAPPVTPRASRMVGSVELEAQSTTHDALNLRNTAPPMTP